MKVGYARQLTRKERVENQIKELREAGVKEVFTEPFSSKDIFTEKSSRFNEMKDYMQEGDMLFIVSLDKISRNFAILIDFIEDLSHWGIELVVLRQPNLTNKDWLYVLDWLIENEEAMQPKLRVISVGKESSYDAKKYSFRSKDPEARRIYWRIVTLLFEKRPLRKVSKELGVPKATVFRIKKKVEKMKQTVWLVIVFLLTIVCLKAAQSYSDNILIQIVICAITTIVIAYLSYSDTKDE